MLKTILAAGAAALLTAAYAAPAVASEIKIAHFMPPQHPMHARVMQPLAEAFNDRMGGAVEMRIYPAGELGKGPAQQYKRAVTGVADIAFLIPEYTPDQFLRSSLVVIPGMFADSASATQAMWENYEEFAPDFEEIVVLGFWTNNKTAILSRERPIRSLADFDGLKVRVGDSRTARVVEAWGAVPVSSPATEVYSMMSSGVIDAAMIDPSAILSFKLGEVTGHITTNAPGAIATFVLAMNRSSYEALSDEARSALDDLTGRAFSENATNVYVGAGARGIETAREAGVEIIELDDAALADFVAAAQPAVDAMIEETGVAAGIDAAALVARMQGSN